MLLKIAQIIMLVLFFAFNSEAQTLYRVYFKDKKNCEYNPYLELDRKALTRRLIHGLDLCHESDYPLNQHYVAEVKSTCDSVLGESRWLNALFIYSNESRIELISKLPFVRSIEKSNATCCYPAVNPMIENDYDTSATKRQYALMQAQLQRMGKEALEKENLDGSGVRIAILDVGFKSYSRNEAFEHIRARGGFISTYDFVKNRSVTDIGMTHGTMVLSCIGGQVNGVKLGLATGAEFLLARTENITEFFNEEEKWLMAAEWADRLGADIINSSLGYAGLRYLPEEMDGKTTFVSRAAQLAVDKGILVVSSAGNEGEKKWKRVAAPGDAAGVLTVGGIDPTTGLHIGFSSYGPSWDFRLKPEVSAYGRAAVAGKKSVESAEGTSFSSPLVAGFAACVKQRYPYLTNLELKELICRSGDLWPYHDYAHGYGVPGPYFLKKDTLTNQPTLSILENMDYITFSAIENETNFKSDSQLTEKVKTFSNAIENGNDTEAKPYNFSKQKFKTRCTPFLYYHIKNNKGQIEKYYVLDLERQSDKSISISKSICEKPFSIAFYYQGYYKELIIKE